MQIFCNQKQFNSIVVSNVRTQIRNPVNFKMAVNTYERRWEFSVTIRVFIIQQIVTLSKYGHDALDICHP